MARIYLSLTELNCNHIKIGHIINFIPTNAFIEKFTKKLGIFFISKEFLWELKHFKIQSIKCPKLCITARE